MEKMSCCAPITGNFKKLLLIMKLCVLFLLVSTATLMANSGYSQNTRLSVHLENVTLKELITHIESQTEFIFVLLEGVVDLNKEISVDVQDQTIDKILDKVFESSGNSYKIFDRQIAIGKKDEVRQMEVLRAEVNLEAEQPQKKEISGTVKDEKGNPLPGVSVVLKGTTTGTVTDAGGNYMLNVPLNAQTFVFSFVGMKSQEIQLGNKTVINVALAEENMGIEEVVAIGYGTIRKKDLTGSVASVSSEALKDIPVVSASDAITGRMAGVQVTRTEGSPDAEIKIRVRGGGSVTQDNSPLFLVDGFPVDNINDIAPTDIETIDVLKDASSTAIYGARGANGVIIITTKGGFEGEAKVNYNAYFGIKNITKYLDVLDSYDYILYQLETTQSMLNFTSAFGDVRDIDLYKEIPRRFWQEDVLGQTGTNQDHNLAVSGGSKTTKYNISLTRNDQKEIMIGSGFSRTNITANASYKVNNWLTVDFKTRFSDSRVKGMGTSSNYSRLSSMVQYRPVEGIGPYIQDALEEEGVDALYNISIQNPVDQTNDDYRRKNTLIYNINGAATIKFSKYLTFRMSYGNDITKIDNKIFFGINTYEARMKGMQPIVRIVNDDIRSFQLSNTLTYTRKNFLPEHNLTILAGEELSSYKRSEVDNKSQYFPRYIDEYSALSNMQLGIPDPTATSVRPDNNLSSYFGRINYDNKGKYLASLSFRADGSSKFAPGNQWGYFPSGSLGWRISDESFLKGASLWLTDLKLRASYGTSGNNRISDNAWQKTFTIQTGNLFKEGDETTQTSYYKANKILSNEKLKWETTITRNLGLDFMLFKQRLNGSVEVYKNTTQDLLIQASIPSSTGYAFQWQNIGQTSNKGIEIVLNGDLVKNNNLNVFFSFNIGFNKNRVDKLGASKRMEQESGWGTSDGALNDYLIEEGSPIGQMFGYEDNGIYSFDDFTYDYEKKSYVLNEGVSDNSAIILASAGWFGPGTLKLKDQNGDLVVNEDDRVVLGNANPKHTGGFTLNAQYKGLDFSAFFNWKYGNDIYNANKLSWSSFISGRLYRNLSADMNNFFRTRNPVTGERVYDPTMLAELNKDAEMWSPYYYTGKLHSYAIEDGSFLRLNTLTIGYSLPKRLITRIGLTQLRIYASGYNLWLWTNYSGYDPEVDAIRTTPLTPGVDYQSYPRSRSYNIGLNVEF